jgi:nucleoside-diphosphate-sugar epimerase
VHRRADSSIMTLAIPQGPIVVTGATGFTGAYVVRALRSRFPETPVRCVVRPTSDRGPIDMRGVEAVVSDLRDGAGLRAAFRGAGTLVNVASLGFDWVENILEAAEAAEISRAVFFSTAILTKLEARSKPLREQGERLVRQSRLAWTILRPTMIYGTPRDRNIARLIRFVRYSPIVPLVAPKALQQPVHVEDVAWAAAAVLERPATVHQIYSLSGEAPTSLRTVTEEVIDAVGRRRLMMTVPVTPVLGLLAIWSRVGHPPVTNEQVRRIEEDKNFDHDDAKRDFGFAPRSFRNGVRAEAAMMGLCRT